VRQKLTETLQQLEAWKSTSLSADYPSAKG